MDNLRKGILVKNGVCVGALGDKYFSNAPIGVIQAFSGQTAPHGYLLCNGASYKVADYPDLYAVIGNTYGGDTENFNVPDYRETVLVGVGENTTDTIASHDVYGLGEFKDDQLQNHYHNLSRTDEGASNLLFYQNNGEGEDWHGALTTTVTGKTATIITTSETHTGRGGTTTHSKQKGVTYIIKAFHTNEGVDSGISDVVINYINNSTKVDVVLYDEFDIKIDNIQNRLYLLGNILYGSLYLRFDEGYDPMVVQELGNWIDIGNVPQIAKAPQLYTCISYADTQVGDDYAQGDVRIWEGKLSIRIKKQPTVSRNNWYIFYNAVCMKVELA